MNMNIYIICNLGVYMMYNVNMHMCNISLINFISFLVLKKLYYFCNKTYIHTHIKIKNICK